MSYILYTLVIVKLLQSIQIRLEVTAIQSAMIVFVVIPMVVTIFVYVYSVHLAPIIRTTLSKIGKSKD